MLNYLLRPHPFQPHCVAHVSFVSVLGIQLKLLNLTLLNNSKCVLEELCNKTHIDKSWFIYVKESQLRMQESFCIHVYNVIVCLLYSYRMTSIYCYLLQYMTSLWPFDDLRVREYTQVQRQRCCVINSDWVQCIDPSKNNISSSASNPSINIYARKIFYGSSVQLNVIIILIFLPSWVLQKLFFWVII